MIPRQRLTAATARRVEQMKALLAELAKTDMTLIDMSATIGCSPSGTRKYMLELMRAKLLVVHAIIEPNRFSHGKPLYRLVGDAAQVAAFVAGIELPPGSAVARPSPKQAARQLEPGRHLHIMGDDVHYAVRLNRSEVIRDWAVAAIFGPARTA